MFDLGVTRTIDHAVYIMLNVLAIWLWRLDAALLGVSMLSYGTQDWLTGSSGGGVWQLSRFITQGLLNENTWRLFLLAALMLFGLSLVARPFISFQPVEIGRLFFFAALFVMVGALEEHGVISRVADGIGAVTGDSRLVEALVVLWGAAAGSAVVDNIPFTAAMIPVVDELQGSDFHEATWWSLALGACFGGNATLIAAAANVRNEKTRQARIRIAISSCCRIRP